VVFGKGGPYGKQSKQRVLPLNPRAFQLLSHSFAHQNAMLLGVRTAERVVKHVVNRAGIIKLVSAHVLRHTFAVTCLKRGINLQALQSLLGQDRIITTQIYMNLSPEDVIQEFQQKWFAGKSS
jgi:integrase/recombinase XerD